MSRAKILRDRKVVQLDRPAQARQTITAEDVQDPEKLARILNELRGGLDEERRAFKPRVLDFEDIAFDATGVTKYRFDHNFNGRIRWWVVEQDDNPSLSEHSSSTANTLVLVSSFNTTCTIRIEEAG